MPFTVENKGNSIIKVDVVGTIDINELKKILTLLTKVFETKKPFAFIVNCNFTEVPSELTLVTKTLVSWMISSEQDIKDYLKGSSIVLKSTVLKNVFNGIFKIRKPIQIVQSLPDRQTGS
jgi:hypothetical protein